ncbi:hypothetical protein [Palleronia caenipelagi]|nr:hypothetical protein [Palleronia caenipelagi]
MKAMLAGFAAVIVIGFGAHFILAALDLSSANAESSSNVRLGEAGHSE